jgi:hypothetical protein
MWLRVHLPAEFTDAHADVLKQYLQDERILSANQWAQVLEPAYGWQGDHLSLFPTKPGKAAFCADKKEDRDEQLATWSNACRGV